MWLGFLAIFSGYFIWTISPAYFLVKFLKGIDDNFTVGLISASFMHLVKVV